MKSGELAKLVESFGPFFQLPWLRTKREFVRREGSWIQIIAFNASRFTEKYVPVSSFEFLKMPGVPTCGFLPQQLQYANGAQRWVALTESVADVFDGMAKQFIPAILRTLRLKEIEGLLNSSLDYWPHPYALCVTRAEDGDKDEAQKYFEAFLSATVDKPYPWVESRRQELAENLSLMDTPLELKTRLAAIEADKLRALRCDGTL
jgi:hypothetical protein